MALRFRRRLRQLAVLALFAVGVVATAATSQPSKLIDITPVSTTFSLNSAHPAAMSRIVVRLNAEATSGNPYLNAYIAADRMESTSDLAGPASSGASDRVRFIVASAVPNGAPSTSATPEPDVKPAPSPWQQEASPPFSVTLPVDCTRAIGPCERAFWLIAELTDAQAGAVDVHWTVTGALNLVGNNWPSGAAATVDVGDPIVLAGPVPLLATSSETESLTLGPHRPAAARLVEVRVGAAAIPGDGSRVGALSLNVNAPPRSPGTGLRPLVVQVYPIDGPNAASPDAHTPPLSPIDADLDPFAGCQPHADCIRHFLVTMAWTGDTGASEPVDWSLTVRRADLVHVWSTPADLSARVVRRFDVAPDQKPATVHLEGDATAGAFDAAPQVRVAVETHVTTNDPLALLLPIPGLMKYQAQVTTPLPFPTGGDRLSTEITTQNSDGGRRSLYMPFVDSSIGTTAGVFAAQYTGCRLSGVVEVCPMVELQTRVSPKDTGAPLPAVAFHWSADVTVYSYVDIPITVSAKVLR